MDANQWQKIASSFSYSADSQNLSPEIQQCHPKPIKHDPTTVTNPNVNNIDRDIPGEFLQPLAASKSQGVFNNSPREIKEVMAQMNCTIQKLVKLVDEKSQVIKKQKMTIAILEEKVKTYSTKQVSNSVISNKNVKKGQSSTGSAELNQSKSHTDSQKTLLPVIINRLEGLEKRMNGFAQSLSKKVQLYCQKFISNCKFRYDESGELLVAVMTSSESIELNKPVWERSPKIKPKVNHAFQVRHKPREASLSLQDKLDIDSNSNHKYKEDISNYLNHLETIVNDLKVGFIQLLLQKVKARDASSVGHLNLSLLDKERIRNRSNPVT